VTEIVTYGDWGQGAYSVDISDCTSGNSLLSYSDNATRMWKTDASFIRPKWGIYRSLENAEDLRDEIVCYADFCIEETNIIADCSAPITFLEIENITSAAADLTWGGVAGAITYNWVVVAAGDGPNGTPVASGITSMTTAMATGLSATTSYDLYVTADCGSTNATGFPFMTTEVTTKVTTDQIGTETSSSSSRGPIHQAGTGASTRYSRFFNVYRESELAAVGIGENDEITELQWFITTSDVIDEIGDAPLKIYIRNSSATMATEDTWTALTAGSTLALNTVLNTANNFPGSAGWMSFALDAPFVYTGGSLEIAVEFDWASVAFTNNGSVKWRYSNYADDVVSRALGSSGYSTNLTYSSTSKQRPNIQFCYEPALVTCAPANIGATNITTSSADLSWDAVSNATGYTWKIVEAGAGADGTAVASGTTTGTSVSATGLTCLTAYDIHIQSDCGADGLSLFSDASTFVTLSVVNASTFTLGTGTSSSSSRGPIQQGGATTSTRYSRFNQVFSATELLAAGLTANSSITELQWYLTTTDIIAGAGDAPFKVYIKNSSATMATVDSWANIIAGSTLVVDRVFNTTNNFPGVEGWMPFSLDVPFIYTGGGLEIAVEWDYGSISQPAFTGSDANNPNGGSIKWRYSDVGNDVVVRLLGSGSHGTSNLSFGSGDLPMQRANIQFVSVPETSCEVSETEEEVVVDLDIESGNDLMFGDPCHCDDPRNCDVSGITYFHDTLTVMSGGVTGLTITAVAGATNFFSAVSCYGGANTLIPAGTIIPESPVGSGVYKIEFWRPSGLTPTLSVQESGRIFNVPVNTFQPVCFQEDCIEEAPIPTMSEWGLIIFGLLILNLGLISIRRKELILNA